MVNDEPLDERRLAAYADEGASLVTVDPAPFTEAGIRLLQRPMLDAGVHAQHDPERLAAALVELATGAGGRR